MDVETLKQKINEDIAEAPLGTLTVTGQLLASDAITALLDDYVDGQPLIIESRPPAGETAEGITVVGTSANTLLEGMTITARFYLVDEQAALVLSAEPPADWTLDRTFPSLSSTFFSWVNFAPPTSFTLASHEGEALPAGLSFSGALQMDGVLEAASWLLGDGAEVRVEGTLQLIDGRPAMSLNSTAAPAGVDLGLLELAPARLELTASPSLESADETAAVARLHSSIVFRSDAGPVSLPLTAESYLNTPWVRVLAGLEEGLTTSLDSLSSLVGDLDLGGVLPQQLPLADEIEFTDLILVLDLRARRLESISLGVRTATPWNLIGEVITLEFAALGFKLRDPAGANELSALFTSEFGVGSKPEGDEGATSG